MRAMRTHPRLPHHGQITNDPTTAADFKKQFPSVFAQTYPRNRYQDQVDDLSCLPHPLHVDEVFPSQYVARIPKRSSNQATASRLQTRGSSYQQRYVNGSPIAEAPPTQTSPPCQSQYTSSLKAQSSLAAQTTCSYKPWQKTTAQSQ